MRGQDDTRRRQVEHVVAAFSLADSEDASQLARDVEHFDLHSLTAAASAADAVLHVAEDDGWGAATFGADFMEGAREDALEDLQRVVEAGRLRLEERRERGPRGVTTRIAEDGLLGWRISRRPTTRLGQLLARPRARRSSASRRRGSRRGTGSGDRAGPDDPDDDDPPGEVEAPPAGGQVAGLIGGAA